MWAVSDEQPWRGAATGPTTTTLLPRGGLTPRVPSPAALWAGDASLGGAWTPSAKPDGYAKL